MPLLFPLFDEQGILCPNVMAQQHDAKGISPEEQDGLDIDRSVNWCMYYANLHRMVPFDEPEVPTQGPDDNLQQFDNVQTYKACLISPMKLDYEALCPQFAWLPTDIIQKTFGGTTQYVHMPYNTVLCHCYKVPNPALNHF